MTAFQSFLLRLQGNDPRTVPTRTRLAFGVGSTAETLALYSLGVIGMGYYNQVLGLDIRFAGAVPTLAIFFDAISDPFMGSFSDRFRSARWGRRHPFMFLAPPFIAVSFWCSFNPPAGLEDWSLFGWLLFWSVCLRTFMTVYHVPHLAMGGELSKEYIERTKIMSYNNFFAWLGGAGLFKLNTVIFFASVAQFSNGFLNSHAYGPFSTTIAIAIFIVLLSSAWFTRDRIPTLPQPPADAKPFNALDFYRDLMQAFRNRNYLFLLIALFCLSMMLGLRGGLTFYMNLYYWELSSADFGNVIIIGSLCGYVTGFFFSTKIHAVFDKRATIVATCLALSVFPAMPVVLRMLGLFPENGSAYLVISIAAFGALGTGAGSILNISVMSALADVADENALKYGIRQEGVIYSARTFFAKLDNSIGHGIAAIALWLIAFPDKAIPGEVDANIISWIGLIDSPIAVVPGVIAAFFYAQYRIDKSTYNETRRKLAVSRGETQGGPATVKAAGETGENEKAQ